MFEKVNPCHPDKVADRIAGALVDAAYRKEENPRIAVEVLIGHGVCHIIAESSVHIPLDEVDAIVKPGRRNPLRRQRHLQRGAGHGGAESTLRDRKKCVSHLSLGWEVHY